MAEESTTPDLVELTRGIFESINRDWNFDAVERFFAPDAVLDLSETLGTYEGMAAIRTVIEDWWATWDDHHHYVQEILDLGHGVLFIAIREDGRVKGTDARVEARPGWVWEWADGLIVRCTNYLNVADARAAAERLGEERG